MVRTAGHLRHFLKKERLNVNSVFTMSDLETITANNDTAEKLLQDLKNELNTIKRFLVARRKKELIEENAKLQEEIETAKKQLILLENQNGKIQVPLPGESTNVSVKDASAPREKSIAPNIQSVNGAKPTEKKPKKEKSASNVNKKVPTASEEAPIDVGRLDFRIGKIVEVSKHPDADSLYLEKIDCGEPELRTVVSGLVKYVPINEMQDRIVVVMCNLKPAKMRGITSEAMVMCASTTDKVEVLIPPAGSVPGDLVHCHGYERKPDAQLNPKKKIFETCAPDLKTNDNLVACYKGSPLHVPGKGNIVTATLKNVQIK